VMPCATSTVHKEMNIADFLVEPQNQDRWFSGLGLKISSSDLMILTPNSP
jgi:hypothetical protein